MILTLSVPNVKHHPAQAALAARLADANGGPIEVAPEDFPDELKQQMLSVKPEKRRSYQHPLTQSMAKRFGWSAKP
jgi:hypothetical protein